ncbi:hypothetical protein D3C78_979080 [compost metagenome]
MQLEGEGGIRADDPFGASRLQRFAGVSGQLVAPLQGFRAWCVMNYRNRSVLVFQQRIDLNSVVI